MFQLITLFVTKHLSTLPKYSRNFVTTAAGNLPTIPAKHSLTTEKLGPGMFCMKQRKRSE